MRYLLFGALGLLLGCASFDKSELYAAYGPEGVVYYRINFRGHGSLGKVDYRSGWYDGKAVDELFGDVTSEGDLRVTRARARQAAIEAATKAYVGAAEKPDDVAMAAAKARLDKISADFSTMAPAEASATEAMDYAGKKFVMVLAHDPDEILKMIGDSIQKDKVVAAVSSFMRDAAESASDSAADALSAASARANQLVEQLTSARSGVAAAANEAEFRNQLQRLKALTAP